MLLQQEPLVGAVPKSFVFFILEKFFFNTLDCGPFLKILKQFGLGWTSTLTGTHGKRSKIHWIFI
jgi:hypothetical protein